MGVVRASPRHPTIPSQLHFLQERTISRHNAHRVRGAAPGSRKYLPVPEGFPTTHIHQPQEATWAPPCPSHRGARGGLGWKKPKAEQGSGAVRVVSNSSALLLLDAHEASEIELVPTEIPQRGKEVVKQHFIHYYLFFFFLKKK